MQLKSFDRNGYAEIQVSESELNALCNALYEYFEVYKPTKVDKRLYEIRRKLYIYIIRLFIIMLVLMKQRLRFLKR